MELPTPKSLIILPLATIVTFLLSTAVLLGQTSASEIHLIKILESDEQVMSHINDLQLDLTGFDKQGNPEILLNDSQLNKLIQAGYPIEYLTLPSTPAHYEAYHDYQEVLDLIDSLARQYPDIVWMDTLGYSQVLGLPIQVLKVSDNPELEEDEPAVLFDGLHHAREPVSTESCLVILSHLLENYQTDPEVQEWVNETEIWFIPMINPDGWKFVTDNTLGNPWWRKNLRDNDNSGSFETAKDGVDLNRNYDFNWNLGGSQDPGSWVYRGPEPFSESEVRIKRDLALQQKFVLSLSYHSHGQIVIYSWSENPQAPDQDLIRSIAGQIATRIPKYGEAGSYRPSVSNCTNGFSRCWMYAVAGTFEFTVETAHEFVPDGETGLEIARDNLNGGLYILDRVKGPGLAGRVTDAVTGEPLIATIKIREIWDPVLTPRTTDSLLGRYYRLLEPGTYTLEVSADGYLPYLAENVPVNDGVWTPLDVPLQPAGTGRGDITLSQDSPLMISSIYPNPFTDQLFIDISLTRPEKISVHILDLLGRPVTGDLVESYPSGNHTLHLKTHAPKDASLGSGYYFIRIQANDQTIIRRVMKN